MRILLAHNSTYYPSHGGGDKSNRLLMRALAERGHRVRVATRVERFGPEDLAKLLRDLKERGVAADTSDSSMVRFHLEDVDVRTLTTNPNLRAFFSRQIADFDPDIILTSTDDPGQLLFDLAVRSSRARVVYLVRATIAVPFGPDSSMPSASKAEVLQFADGIVGVSHYVAGYVRQWSGLDAIHVPISLLEPVDEYPYLGSFTNRFVAMVNPCAVKGIGIFLELADRMPHVEFAAVPTWGTTPDDIAALKSRSNVTVIAPVDNIDELLRQTKIMLIPSVWAEARSRMVLESMSRGVPVVASDVGGLHEALLGVDYLVPIHPITHYKPSVDMNMVPIADVPPQNIAPWQKIVERLTTDREHFEELSRASRKAALEYARNLNVIPFERFLEELKDRPKKAPPKPPRPALDSLSEDKKKLLALRLRQKAAKTESSPWFIGLEEHELGRTLLFCFPYAGGGTLLYRSWREFLSPAVTICAVRLPARESRLGEPPIDQMRILVETLGHQIVPYLHKPFAFFGHSMGAVVAFELARWLRGHGYALPSALYVSAARAPQFRLHHQPGPEPEEGAFLDELRRLEGMPREILDNEKLMEIALPSLRADARLYRNYIYQPAPPFGFPIHAYGGIEDPNITQEHLQAWREQTTAAFSTHQFRGGHFYLQNSPEFLHVLASAL